MKKMVEYNKPKLKENLLLSAKNNLGKLYQKFLKEGLTSEVKDLARHLDRIYRPGAETLFPKNVSGAIWGTHDLFKGTMSIEKAKKILEELHKS